MECEVERYRNVCVVQTCTNKMYVQTYLLHNVRFPSSSEAGGVHFDTYNLNSQSQLYGES